jgi:tRNA A-37 threonylcarbamoyl transferase component Bud32
MPGRSKQPIWIMPLFIAVMVALIGWWGNCRVRDAIETNLKADLTTTLNANVMALEIWTTNQMRMATSLAAEPAVHTLAGRLLDAPLPRGNFTPSPDAIDLGNYLRPRLSLMGYEIAQLVNTNFFVVANSTRGPFGVGEPVSEAHMDKYTELFTLDRPVIITPFKMDSLVDRRPLPWDNNRRRGRFNYGRRRGDEMLMQVATPIRENGVVCGALALIINPTNEFSKVLSVAHRGETGETFAFDQTGLLISESRFDTQLHGLGLLAATNVSSALNVRLRDPGGDLTQGYVSTLQNRADDALTHIVASAVAGTNGVDVVPSRDYRGVPVVGAWCWLPQYGIGVATEMEASEAFWLLQISQFVFITLFLLLILCATVLFVFSYANFTSQRRLDEAESKLKQLGQYSLEEKIGEGSMGVVYRARHALMRRDTAVKLLLPELANAVSIERFQQEVHLTCQLAHPNTIQIYDYGHTPEGVFYYAMEFLKGLNLRQLVDEFGPQPEGRVINILTQICNSLAEAHARKLVHRDIKPSNVFISDRGGVPDYVKVLDFGLVREYSGDGEKKDDHEMVGTPWFMSPESIQNPATSDPRSDIYSVGGLAYYLLTGSHVFEHESADEVYQRQLTAEPVPPSQITDNPISAELDEIILRCLKKNPLDRPQSVLELFALLLTSPRAEDSTPETRAAWWQGFHARKNAATAAGDGDGSTTLPDVKIDFDSRMES